MAPSQRATGSKPSPEQGKAKTRRSKRTVTLEKQQKEELLKRISRLEFQQAFGDEKAEHDATKAIASRLRLEHNDLVTRLDEAETAVANAESRAWKSEREIIKLQESLSESKMGAQNNEAWMELMAEENQQLEVTNTRIVARNIRREGELIQEIELMEERAQSLEQSLTIAYKDVEEYGVLFQKNTEDWAELVNFLNKHKSEDGERIQKLRRSVMEYSNAMEGVHDEVNKLIQAAEVRIARNRLRRDKAVSKADPRSVQWDSQISRSGYHASSEENIRGSLPLLGSPDSDSDSLPGTGEFVDEAMPCDARYEYNGPYISLHRIESDTTGLMSSSGTYIEPAKHGLQSLDALAPLVDDGQCGFAVFDVNGTCRGCESTLSDSFDSDSDTKYDRDQERMFGSFLQHWTGDSSISQAWERHPYNGQGRLKSWDQITNDSSSPEGTDIDSYMGVRWSIPSVPEPTSLSNSHLSNLSFESWKFLKEPSGLVQERTEIDRPRVKSLPVYFEHLPNGYTPPLKTSRKRVRFSPPSSNPNCDVDDESSVNSEQDESIPNQDLSTDSSYLNVVPSSGPTDCEVPQSALNTWIVDDGHDQASTLSVDHRQGNPIINESDSRGIQTEDTPLLERPDNLAASLKALMMAPMGPLDPGGKLRSLSVGDLPRVPATGGTSAFERMPGSWPREAISYADISPEIASEIANAALRGFRASMENVLPVGMKLLNFLNPSHPRCIVYPGLMALWVWQTYEQYVEWQRWERAHERYMVQRLRNQYALQVGWVDSMGFSLAQWLAFDRSSFG
ncbi:uncharacterized protein N7496_004213 [Penicillium cataractarum]|uniref:Uncharacterized protein n=1 Tax=Penicillium cataractarum TaxID=2100454 RepID=A0A9W9SNQ8_9EURO|nr:uncharacterized protein N7496_004213 [Penicillium cataractarum]KAJ5381785.1 hypothetical protein N7496_004213 [Penicillium cataractarum]